MARGSPKDDVPAAGHARLAESSGGLFTSDFTVNEFLLVHEAGFDPLGLVLGELHLPHRLAADERGPQPRAVDGVRGSVQGP